MPCRHLFPAIFVALFFTACRKPVTANWDVDVVVPVVNSSMNISNFIADTIFSADQEGLLHFRLKRQLASMKLDSLIELPDTTINQPFTYSIQLSAQSGVPINLFPPSELEFNITNGIQLTRIDMRRGSLKVKFANTLSETIRLDYEVPNATRDGLPLRISEDIPPGGTAVERKYDLSGYRFNMRGLSGNKVNTIAQGYTITIFSEQETVVIPANTGASADISYEDLVPDYIEGYFGNETIEIPADSTSFDLFRNVRAKNFMLSKARMQFTILNEFGADFAASFANIRSVNLQNGGAVSLVSDKLSLIHINSALRSGNAVTPRTKSIVFDETNSNITAFISNLPDRISYEGSVQVNPPPVDRFVGHSNYAFYDKGITVLADIDIPVRFSADEIALLSEREVNLGNVQQLERVNSGRFVVRATNGYPFAARLQAYMIDAHGVAIDSVFVQGANVVRAASIDQNNIVTEPAYSEIFVPVDKIKIENLRRTAKMRVISAFLLPPSPPDVPVLEHYEIDLQIIAELNFRTGLDGG